MTQRSSNLWSLTPLLMIAGLSFWLNSAIAPESHGDIALRHDPDFWVDTFSIKRFDADGQPLSTLWGQKMVHFPDDETTLISNPKLTFFRDPPIQLSATAGLVAKDGKEVTLTETVLIKREGKPGELPIELRTNAVVLYPDTEQARADSHVVMTQGRSILSGSAMSIDNKTGVSILNGPVTATFHNSNRP